MHWVIGTAGHIDHGKTSLVKALTGIDTDRLKEEKERGISIDLGFASLVLADGARVGVVDVPGHERFIRNMLAGAHGIDLVLFTVAADDGVMPQTEEHLDIIHLLGVREAVFVLTKTDLVSPERARDAAGEVRALVAGTRLEGAPVVPFAAPTGAGLESVRGAIERALQRCKKTGSSGRFRLPVDRAFTSTGHGLIVTGTAISGTVRGGDRLRCLPSGEVLRVRAVEVHGEPVDFGSRGQRIALNLTAPTPITINRGDVMVDEATTLTCDRFDATLEMRPAVAGGLKDHQRVRVHLGTTERIGKVIPLRARERSGAYAIAPGERAFCQLVLTEPMVAMRGDRFIVRDETAQRTLGGGVVLLPAAPKRKRADSHLLSTLDALESSDNDALLEALVEDSGTLAVPLSWLAQRLNDSDDAVRSLADNTSRLHRFVIDADRAYYSTPRLRAAAVARLVQLVGNWHVTHPLSPGIDLEEARTALRPGPDLRLFRALVDELDHDQTLVREGSALRLPSHRLVVAGTDQVLVDRIVSELSKVPLAPPDVKQLCEQLGVERTKLLPLLKAMERRRQIIGVNADLYFATATVDHLRAELARELAGGRELTTAGFRDRYGTSRKYAIPLLEYFDRDGVTVRIGDVRRLKR